MFNILKIHKKIILFLFFILFAFQFSLAQNSSALNFYGSGDIQKSLDAGKEIPANTGLGVNYLQGYDKDSLLWNNIDRLELDVSINVASTVDTLRAEYDSLGITNSSDFGSSILTPLNSGQAVKIGLRLNFYKPVLYRLIDGIKAKYVGSNRDWMALDNNKEKVIRSTNNSLRIGLFHEFLPKNLLDFYSISLGVNFAYNSVKGDMGLDINSALRESILGTRAKKYMGPEIALEIRLKNLRAEFGYSWLSADKEVAGLTGARMVTTISFVGGFGLNMKNKKNDE